MRHPTFGPSRTGNLILDAGSHETHGWRKAGFERAGLLPGGAGSLLTRRWRRESRANPSLGLKFRASWENTGNFVLWGLQCQPLARNTAEIQTFTIEFPTHPNRE